MNSRAQTNDEITRAITHSIKWPYIQIYSQDGAHLLLTNAELPHFHDEDMINRLHNHVARIKADDDLVFVSFYIYGIEEHSLINPCSLINHGPRASGYKYWSLYDHNSLNLIKDFVFNLADIKSKLFIDHGK